jgi:hypothetical protein
MLCGRDKDKRSDGRTGSVWKLAFRLFLSRQGATQEVQTDSGLVANKELLGPTWA